MIYFLAAIGLYFVFNFIGYALRQNNGGENHSNNGSKTLTPIEAQRERQKNMPLLPEEMMAERIARLYASRLGLSFEQLQYQMRFLADDSEHEYNMELLKSVLEKEQDFVKKYGFNMTEKQVDIAISNHMLILDDEDAYPYW